ncbi:MAG: response regulator transcription factor [Sphingobacteriales bacterium JAD_PAG50586_3]|nr:MAG: response regulator transcription factor [Sphingobacteriales bacterium JAD_PAG50586_3]
MNTITYAITDDHKIFRKGLKLILDDDKKLEFVGEAENGHELLELLKNTHIDVILLDLKMPEMDGFEVAKRIRAQNIDSKIIILTMHDDAQFIVRLMETGANGYLVKNTDPSEVKTAIYSVMESGYYFNDHVSSAMLKTLINKNNLKANFKNSIELNDKEKEVLQLICQEFTAAEIAEKVFLSPRTVEGIRSSLLEKIGVRNTVGLVVYALKHGIYEG